MAITNQVKALSLTTEYLNLPTTSGLSPEGYWYHYVPAVANNSALAASIKPYHWGDPLSLTSGASNLQINGTLAIIVEPWEGANVSYHGGSIEWIGAGNNDITATQEADAFFFPHLGTLSTDPDDDAFYWDRAYTDVNGLTWDYYQYHKHLPTLYPRYEQGRMTHSARGYINPSDKAFGYMINSRVTVMSTDYYSILARIHTPSIGGAHSSHNDVTLPSVSTKNYMPGGIIKGNSNRFHAFYISANSSNWDVYTRTYSQTSLSFSTEVFLGTYDLADPIFNPVAVSGTQSQYPMRASTGTVYDERIYFPVIFNNASSGFDLKIWSLNSLDTIAGGSLQQFTLSSGVAARPDCHLKVFNNILYALYTDITNGGVRLQSYNIATGVWTDEGQVLTNSNTKHIRVHGFEYNSADTKFYALLSGTALAGTYTGPGLYSFNVTGVFSGYPHIDYDSNTNSFITKNALATGHLRYNQITGELTKFTTAEPAGIPSGTNILQYLLASPQFINLNETALGAKEYYYQGLQLRDGRKMFVGRIVGNDNNFGVGETGDFFVTLYSESQEHPHHFAWGGAGDDYITSIYESATSRKVWMTGYTKSQIVETKDFKVHGFCRNIADGSNAIEFVDQYVDADGNIFVVGNHVDGYIMLFKYDANYNIVWQNTFNRGVGVDKAYRVIVGGDDHVYICGSTNAVGEGGTDAILMRIRPTGRLEFVTAYGTVGNEYASGFAYLTLTGGTVRIVMSVVSGTSTTFLIVNNITGAVVNQYVISNLVVNNVRADTNNVGNGQFIFAGSNGAITPSARFGVGAVNANPLLSWIGTYTDDVSSCVAYDIRTIDADEYVIVGSIGTSGLVVKTQVTANVPSKVWARQINTSVLSSAVLDSSGNIYAVGYTTASGVVAMGMDDGLIIKLNSSGSVVWQNAFGHDMDERVVSVSLDTTEENLITVGWSESHSFSRDGFLFRCWTGGYGTGYYHLQGNPGIPYIYNKTVLTTGVESSSLSTIASPTNVTGNLTATGGVFTPFVGDTFTITNSGTNNYIFNGGEFTNAIDPTITLAKGGTYTFNMAFAGPHPFFIKSENTVGGASGLYNSGVTNNGATAGQTLTFTVPEDAPDVLYYRCGNHSGMAGQINIVDNPTLSNGFTQTDFQYNSNIYDGSLGPDGVFTFWLGYIDLDLVQEYLNSAVHRRTKQSGYEIDYTSNVFKFYQVGVVGDGTADDGNIFGYDIIEGSDGTVWVAATTSGDVAKTNTGAAGVYDYLLIEFDPVTETFEYYQNGTTLDEEVYALTELSNGKIAYVGRTTGNLGSANLGGYDIFLGIFDPVTETSTYFSTGTGLDDKGVNVHDLGNNTLAVTFTSYGALGPTNTGTEDIGVIEFNYDTNTWGTAYQTGSQASEFVEQNGKPSVLLEDGRIVICCSTAGIFADNSVTYGFLDVGVAVLDRAANTWGKYQYGSGASDFASSISTVGDRLLISGYTRATFADSEINGMFLEFDVTNSVGAKAAVT